jgi:hypothetical protein
LAKVLRYIVVFYVKREVSYEEVPTRRVDLIREALSTRCAILLGSTGIVDIDLSTINLGPVLGF